MNNDAETADDQDEVAQALVVHLGDSPLPFFAEYPYFLWGEVNYDSDGDCERPTDRSWTELWLTNRADERHITACRASPDAADLRITGGEAEDVERAAYLTALRTGGTVCDTRSGAALSQEQIAVPWSDLAARLADADAVRTMFLDAALTAFDDHAWWGGWKWKGDFATEFATGLRQTIKAVHERKADDALLAWLRAWWDAPPQPFHREGVRQALRTLTEREP